MTGEGETPKFIRVMVQIQTASMTTVGREIQIKQFINKGTALSCISLAPLGRLLILRQGLKSRDLLPCLGQVTPKDSINKVCEKYICPQCRHFSMVPLFRPLVLVC